MSDSTTGQLSLMPVVKQIKITTVRHHLYEFLANGITLPASVPAWKYAHRCGELRRSPNGVFELTPLAIHFNCKTKLVSLPISRKDNESGLDTNTSGYQEYDWIVLRPFVTESGDNATEAILDIYHLLVMPEVVSALIADLKQRSPPGKFYLYTPLCVRSDRDLNWKEKPRDVVQKIQYRDELQKEQGGNFAWGYWNDLQSIITYH
jgi:hypothetical protein